jgi:hypothetical protein
MNGFIMAPTHNKEGRADATGAFHVGAAKFQKIHSLPPWVKFENDETSKTADAKGFLKKITDQPGGWDVFAYFGHGNNGSLGSADVRGRKGASALADAMRPKCNDGIIIMLYACNTGAPGGFAQWLSEDLAGKNATVYAHVPPPGHSFTNANVVSYPGGEFVVPRSSPLWKDWYKDMHAEHNELWARFPFMTQEELEAELSAPGGLMGRWEVKGKNGSWQEVFFGNKTVYRIDSDHPYMIDQRGTWSTVRHMLTVTWGNGETEDWPLALTPKLQNVRHRANGTMTAMTARRIEAPNVNESSAFQSPFKLKQSKLIKVN